MSDARERAQRASGRRSEQTEPVSDAMFRPAPGAAPLARMLVTQTSFELRLLLRNGEQLLLTLIIPALLLVLFGLAPVLGLPPGERVDFLTPGIIALAVMSTAFTSQAINTGFQRRYGLLKRLGATPLPRWALLVAKTAGIVAIEAGQILLLAAVAISMGWDPRGSALAAAGLVVLGTVAFSGLGLLLAGTLRAEATLAAANLVYVVFLALGGVVFPLEHFSPGIRAALELLPISALAGGLRDVLQHGAAFPGPATAVLATWSVLALAAASVTFSWE